MLYCKRCRSVCEEHHHRCPNCKSNKLRQAHDEDLVFLHRADLYTAQRLADLFQENGIACQLEEYGRGLASSPYDTEVMPTDKGVYVAFKDLPAARGLSAQLREELQQEQAQEGEAFEDMPRRKRILVQALSAMAFIVLVVLTVFAADAVAGWLKSLLGLG